MSLTFPTTALKKPSGLTAPLPSKFKRPAFGSLYGFDAQGGAAASFVNEKSVLFDGTDDMADSGATFNSIWSGSFSISLWYKSPSTFAAGVDNFLGNKYAAGKGNIEFRMRQQTSSTASIELYFSPEAGTIQLYAGLTNTGANYLSANTWYHLCWVADRPASGTTSSLLYMNGTSRTLVHTGGASTIQNAGGTFDNNTLIGARNTATSGSGSGQLFLDGHLDEMAFFNSTLTADDVDSIYNGGVPNDLSVASSYDTDRTSDLVHWWRFGDGTEAGAGDVIHDMAGSTNLTTSTDPATYSTDVPS